MIEDKYYINTFCKLSRNISLVKLLVTSIYSKTALMWHVCVLRTYNKL